jgi:hypothetical protein
MPLHEVGKLSQINVDDVQAAAAQLQLRAAIVANLLRQKPRNEEWLDRQMAEFDIAAKQMREALG